MTGTDQITLLLVPKEFESLQKLHTPSKASRCRWRRSQTRPQDVVNTMRIWTARPIEIDHWTWFGIRISGQTAVASVVLSERGLHFDWCRRSRAKPRRKPLRKCYYWRDREHRYYYSLSLLAANEEMMLLYTHVPRVALASSNQILSLFAHRQWIDLMKFGKKANQPRRLLPKTWPKWRMTNVFLIKEQLDNEEMLDSTSLWSNSVIWGYKWQWF